VWYVIIFGLLTLYVVIDGSRRNLGAAKTILWAIGTFLLGVIVLPLYFAKRPLRANEVREGGFAWNILKNFALTWTILMVAISITAISAASQTNVNSGAEAAGAALGMGIVIVILAVLWFVPMVGAIVLGFFLKNSAIVERGPTGPLAQEARVA
jgi:low temperature requirement protein LtrA